MRITNLKKRFYKKLKRWFYWEKVMATYHRVKFNIETRQITEASESESIQPPEIEMWAIYDLSGKFCGMYPTEEEAALKAVEETKKERKLSNRKKSAKKKKP